jgi:hypothetical protein
MLVFFPLKDFNAEFVHWLYSLFHCWKDLWNFCFWWCPSSPFIWIEFLWCPQIFPPLTGFFSLWTGRNVKGQGWGRSGMGSMAMFEVKNCRKGKSFWVGTLCSRNQSCATHFFVSWRYLFRDIGHHQSYAVCPCTWLDAIFLHFYYSSLKIGDLKV